MTTAIVRFGARVERVRVWLTTSQLAGWMRGKKARFADLQALRRGELPKTMRDLAQQRRIAVGICGTLCVTGYIAVLVLTVQSHSFGPPPPPESVAVVAAALPSPSPSPSPPPPPLPEQKPSSPPAAETIEAPADLAIDVDRAIDARDEAIDHILADRAQAALDRDRAVAERDRALAERDAALAADREMLLDLHARTSRTIAEIEGILAATGVDSAHILKSGGKTDATRPRGGPFVPWSERAVRDSGFDAARRLASLTWGVERLSALRDLLAHMPLASPLARIEIFDGFGYRHDPFTGRDALHEGLDLRGTPTTPAMATADGVVSFAGWHPDYGNLVEINHGYGIVTRYAHLGKILVKTGAPVAVHQQIGIVGGTGRATAVHLHYEVRVDGRARNPVNFFKAGHHVPEADHVDEQEIPLFGPDTFAGFDSRQGTLDFRSALDHQR